MRTISERRATKRERHVYEDILHSLTRVVY
jgi:hypothetical protein